MVVLTTSTAGLGHKRVTNALEQGLPKFIHEEELGANDPLMQSLHRLASHNVSLRWLMEKIQNTPTWDGYFARIYGGLLRRNSDDVYERLKVLIERRSPRPKVVLVVCTHFSLAHELAAVKDRLSKNLKIKVLLAVVVTDDSPQKIWAVYGADYIFTPSYTTKSRLLEFIADHNLRPVPEMVVKAYPVSPRLGQKLSKDEFQEKTNQVKANSKQLKIMVPISGAAVQLKYLRAMVENLCQKKQAEVTIISRESGNTIDFINWAKDHPCVNIIAKSDDRDVVGEYEEEYLRNIYSLEITKPSEQSFKTLLNPRQRGGVIMLFSDPVGRQEDDNVRFMTRHGLLPNEQDAKLIRGICLGEVKTIDQEFLKRARHWRGILLPMEGAIAGKLVRNLQQMGVFSAMMDFAGYVDHEELTSEGVKEIWQYLEKKVKEYLKN
jgi:hypothetical protein